MNKDFSNPPDTGNNLKPISINNPRYPPLKAAFIGLGVVLFLNIVVASVLHLLIFGFKPSNAMGLPVRLLQMANQLWFFLLPALALSLYIFKDVSRIIRFRLPEYRDFGVFSIGLFVLIPLLNSFMVLQNYCIQLLADRNSTVKQLLDYLSKLDIEVQGVYSSILTPNNFLDVIIIIAVVAITPAICEEVFFRGFLQKSLELRYSKYAGALISAIVFGLLHMNPFATIPLVTLGLYFGYAIIKTDSIFVSMLLHFLNNMFAVTVFLLASNKEKELETFSPVSLAEFQFAAKSFLSLAILFGIVLFIINRYYSIKQKS